MASIIKDIRLVKGMTQKELAEAVGVKQPEIARIENSENLSMAKAVRVLGELGYKLVAVPNDEAESSRKYEEEDAVLEKVKNFLSASEYELLKNIERERW